MNHLSDSLSPYLLQHKNNPVDWYPWCEAAFELARDTDRPIFLSVGYAACHWCHVMEHESFENPSIAEYLNENFVSIKVDREERPDIDQIYMNAVQLMTGRGGWPMSVFLNHDRQPFYAGTYWPPTPKQGMPGFVQVLDALAHAWKEKRGEVSQQAGEISAALQRMAVGSSRSAASVPDPSIVSTATDYLLQVFDSTHGGFGGAPKFPHATDLMLLLSQGHNEAGSELVAAAELTLDSMAAGGIRDHIGGGFARYSVDAVWLVPHFEKMMYDNALLGEVYVRAFQVTGNTRHADVARETFDYLCRDMVDPSGGLHCSEDADSEGVEGRFYVWTPTEVIEVLGAVRGQRFCDVYDITERGNFEGKNIPRLLQSIDALAGKFGIDADQLSTELKEDREQLRQARDGRVHPGRDDKVLTAWNALAIKSLAVGGGVLDHQPYIDAALRAAEFLLREMVRPDGRLLHAFRQGQAHLDAYVDDYAFTIEAYISLHESTGNERWIEQAVRLADEMLHWFEDQSQGGFFYTASDAESLLTRNKDWHDGSLVSGNASAAMALLKLSRLIQREDYREAAERTLRAGDEVMSKQFAACGALLTALGRYWNDTEQLTLAVRDDAMMREVRGRLLRRFRPDTTISWVVGDDSHGVISLNQDRRAIDGKPTLYRCQSFSCDQPLVGEEAIRWLRNG